jgi:hypothetical protein
MEAARMQTELTKLLGAQAEKLYPMQLAKQHPRIIDRIVELWKQGSALEQYLDDLLIDRRGNREGFPPAMLMEILSLKNYCQGLKHQPDRNPNTWGELTDIDESVQKAR